MPTRSNKKTKNTKIIKKFNYPTNIFLRISKNYTEAGGFALEPTLHVVELAVFSLK
ncbi:MAG: hypothetical protein LBH59_02085 [Planctomycetaceae bacterium]|jgi:hypothetical protein|nr:hypothetical protein [Planctomycetaceae bacterium]